MMDKLNRLFCRLLWGHQFIRRGTNLKYCLFCAEPKAK